MRIICKYILHMNIHEYQGKIILKKYGVPVPEGYMVESTDAAVEAAKKIR